MSTVANWSYTAMATIWPLLGKDEYNQSTYGSPVSFHCNYGSEAKTYKDSSGLEFVSRITLWHEDYPEAKRGDYVAIGVFTDLNPIDVIGSDEVRTILNYGNTLDRSDKPDYAIITG